jgi:hypothetical protein
MLSRDEFLEKYRHLFRSIVLDGFIRRADEPDENKWKRISHQADKVDAALMKIFDELTKPPQKGPS